MEKRLIQYRLENGETAVVEVEEPKIEGVEPISRKPGEKFPEAQETLESVLKEVIKPFAIGSSAIVSQLKEMDTSADEMEIKFGIVLSSTAGAFLTVGGQASYEVTLKWNTNKDK